MRLAEIYNVIMPIIQERRKSKQTKVDSMAMEQTLAQSRRRMIKESVVTLFSCPNIPKNRIQNPRCTHCIKCCHLMVDSQ